MKATLESVQELRGSVCPSCERYMGPLEECPYCGADSARDPVFRLLKWSAVVFAVIGICFLFLMARARETPLVRAGAVNSMMNHAFVKISGRVDGKPFTARKNGDVDYLSFSVSDGSGVVRVCMYRKVARDFSLRKMVAGRNEKVEVRGSLNVADDNNLKLIVQSADHVRVLE